jgi:hypothetical protein
VLTEDKLDKDPLKLSVDFKKGDKMDPYTKAISEQVEA